MMNWEEGECWRWVIITFEGLNFFLSLQAFLCASNWPVYIVIPKGPGLFSEAVRSAGQAT